MTGRVSRLEIPCGPKERERVINVFFFWLKIHEQDNVLPTYYSSLSSFVISLGNGNSICATSKSGVSRDTETLLLTRDWRALFNKLSTCTNRD